VEVQGAEVYVSRDLSSEDEGGFLAQVRLVMPVRNVGGLGFRAGEPTSAAHVVADVLTWTSILKVAAGLFLSQLAKNAADEVWEKKGDILKVLGTEAARPLRLLAKAFSAINQRALRTDARIGFPYPDPLQGTVLPIRSANELEAAWLLANFVMNVDNLKSEVKKALESGARPITGFFVDVSTEGAISLFWFEIDGKKVCRIDYGQTSTREVASGGVSPCRD
jgi:hypothetical protein